MSLQAGGMDAPGLLAAADALGSTSEDYGNDSRVEALWAIKAIEHAEVYFNILCSVKPVQIPRLSPCDEKIYSTFREKFPDLAVQKLDEVSDLKSEDSKAKWREFCNTFKDLEDFNFATLLRLDSTKDYEENNSVIVTKVQFYAIELARNREGHNDSIRFNFKPKPRTKRPANPQPNTSEPGFMGSQMERELQQILTGSHPMLKS